jgi:16S rRNA (guanine(966)-N(2))-methyltransferase RsmD
MRVLGGTHKGRRLYGPKSHRLRPTSARVKEALFSILGSRVVGSRFLDLYAGSGAVGIEALSRGAAHATFVESDPAAVRLLQANLARCGFQSSGEIHGCSVETFLMRSRRLPTPYDLVFVDPPYGEGPLRRLWAALASSPAVASHALLVFEHSTMTAIPRPSGRFLPLRQYRYGDTTLSLFATLE